MKLKWFLELTVDPIFMVTLIILCSLISWLSVSIARSRFLRVLRYCIGAGNRSFSSLADDLGKTPLRFAVMLITLIGYRPSTHEVFLLRTLGIESFRTPLRVHLPWAHKVTNKFLLTESQKGGDEKTKEEEVIR